MSKHATTRPTIWRLLCIIIALGELLCLGISTKPVAAEPIPVQVKRVIDGDTIILSNGDKVRYIGIDTPELHRRQGDRWRLDPEPYAAAAKAENKRLLQAGAVRLEVDKQLRDRYGRRLAYVFVNDQMINEQLVLSGLARAKPYPPNLRHQARLAAAERIAREHKRGLWAR